MPPELIQQLAMGVQYAAAGQMSQMVVGVGVKQDGTPIGIRIIMLPESLGDKAQMKMFKKPEPLVQEVCVETPPAEEKKEV